MIPAWKEQLHILISSSVLDNFRKELTVNKTFWRRGEFTNEIENAIKNHTVLLRTRNKQTQSTNLVQNDSFGLVQVRDDIFNFMIDKEYWKEPMRYITEKHLKESIEILKGRTGPADKRTINSWIRKLKIGGIIEQSGVHEYMFCDLETEVTSILSNFQKGQGQEDQGKQMEQHEFKEPNESNIVG